MKEGGKMIRGWGFLWTMNNTRRNRLGNACQNHAQIFGPMVSGVVAASCRTGYYGTVFSYYCMPPQVMHRVQGYEVLQRGVGDTCRWNAVSNVMETEQMEPNMQKTPYGTNLASCRITLLLSSDLQRTRNSRMFR